MTVHVVGAGLAGLSAALAAIDAGHRVILHEAAAHAGGRCRSFDDAVTGRVLDNGSHMVLGANAAVFAFLRRIGAEGELVPVDPPELPFLDLHTRETWRLRPGRPLPFAGLLGHLALLRLASGGSVAQALRRTRAYERLWRPLTEAALNTPPEQASARLLGRVLAASLRGTESLRPFVARHSLDAAFISPAVTALRAAGLEIRFRHALKAIDGDRAATALRFDDDATTLGPHDRVVLAVPPWTAADLLPELPRFATASIVNAHYRLDRPVIMPSGPFLGLVGGAAQWLFARDDVLSVTVSAADGLAELPAPEVAGLLWRDAACALGLSGPVPPCRVIKEKRATVVQDDHFVRRRPGAKTRFTNVALAGDWTATGLPCTIEGAIRSGTRAARLFPPQPPII